MYIYKKPPRFVDKYISKLKNTDHFCIMLSFENRESLLLHAN